MNLLLKGIYEFAQSIDEFFGYGSTDLRLYKYIYKAKNCKLLVLLTHAQKTNFIFK